LRSQFLIRLVADRHTKLRSRSERSVDPLGAKKNGGLNGYADEIVALYHERWELELGYDEIKTHMLEREEALRSKKPEGVEQEIWGILLAYNLVRCKMLEVSRAFDMEPNRISFRHSLQLIRVFCLVEAWTAPPTKLPRRLEELADMVSSLLVLPERRPERRYERSVKIKMSNFKRNTGRHTRKSST